ncbi:hypothetical protein [Gordonia sp. SND2]|uniref:hypothetical protein n=1 Tax=Gordonia sp. SND2 TaxID=3388659 RepID=UPI00398B9F5C
MILTPAERERLGRCHHCEHHPPTQGHAIGCPTRVTWRGSGAHTPIDHHWDIPTTPATPNPPTNTSTADTPELTLDL